MTVDEKLAALADRCHSPHFGPEGVCDACCFARKVTTQIAATPLSVGSAGLAQPEDQVRATLAICGYRQRVVLPLLELHELSNPGLAADGSERLSEGEQVKRAFAEAPAEERSAFATLIETFYAQHVAAPARSLT